MLKGYVINMDKDTERMETFKKNWSDIKTVEIERFPAIVGKNIRSSDKVSKYCQKYCSNGMIGCFASHLAVMELVVNNNLDQCLILEDDSYPVKNFDKRLTNIIQDNSIPKDFDMLLFGHIGETKPSWFSNFMRWLVFNNSREYKVINDNIIVPFQPLGTYAYLISQKGAKKILQHYNIIKYHVDYYIYTRNNIKLYTVQPFLVKTPNSSTCLGEKHALDLSFIDHLQLFNNENNIGLTWYLNNVVCVVGGTNIRVWHVCLIIFIFFFTSLCGNGLLPIIIIFLVIIYFIKQLSC
jgi:GR25 family glycosyltransferase involved in LPS biosynthesis